jgi:hypothetical protein
LLKLRFHWQSMRQRHKTVLALFTLGGETRNRDTLICVAPIDIESL